MGWRSCFWMTCAEDHEIFPCCLRDVSVCRRNSVLGKLSISLLICSLMDAIKKINTSPIHHLSLRELKETKYTCQIHKYTKSTAIEHETTLRIEKIENTNYTNLWGVGKATIGEQGNDVSHSQKSPPESNFFTTVFFSAFISPKNKRDSLSFEIAFSLINGQWPTSSFSSMEKASSLAIVTSVRPFVLLRER